MKPSKRSEKIKLSSTIKMADLVREMEANGETIIRLETGESYLKTPLTVKNASIKALKENKTFYSHSRGIYELRKEVCDYYNQKYKTDFNPQKNVIITPGAKQALLYAILGYVDEGEEVIIPKPSWVTYSEIVKIAGGNPILVNCEEKKDFQLSPDRITDHINKNTKVIILNSPNNPTGKTIPKKDMEKINHICLNNNILLISDEIYDRILYDGKQHDSILNVNPGLNNSILINGFSKTYSMTGWRLGYILASPSYIQVLTKFQQNSMTCPTTFSQYGALEALQNGESFVEKSLNIYQKNRNYLISEIEKLTNFDIIQPDGGLYAFIKVSKITNDACVFCLNLLKRSKISVLPGEEFGRNANDYIRVCLATDFQNLEKFIEVLKNNY